MPLANQSARESHISGFQARTRAVQPIAPSCLRRPITTRRCGCCGRDKKLLWSRLENPRRRRQGRYPPQHPHAPLSRAIVALPPDRPFTARVDRVPTRAPIRCLRTQESPHSWMMADGVAPKLLPTEIDGGGRLSPPTRTLSRLLCGDDRAEEWICLLPESHRLLDRKRLHYPGLDERQGSGLALSTLLALPPAEPG